MHHKIIDGWMFDILSNFEAYYFSPVGTEENGGNFLRTRQSQWVTHSQIRDKLEIS